MANAEQKVRVPVLVPSAPESRPEAWNPAFPDGGGGAAPEAKVAEVWKDGVGWGLDGSAGEGKDTPPPAHALIDEKMNRGAADERVPAGEAGPRELNQSLARLEMNSLEVKLFLDSIDKRISRMEPRLEGMRGEPGGAEVQRAADAPAGGTATEGAAGERWADGDGAVLRGGGEAAAADAAGVAVPADAEVGVSGLPSAGDTGLPLPGVPDSPAPGAEATPVLSTSERRRRAQGVPVERRRAPHALPFEEKNQEAWAWKPRVQARWQALADRATPTRHKWVPAVLLGAMAITGLTFWISRPHVRPRVQTVATNASVQERTDAAAGGLDKRSAEMPWLTGAGSSRAGGGRGASPGRSAGGRVASTSVEQGVAVPMSSGAAPGVQSGAGSEEGSGAGRAQSTTEPVTNLPGDAGRTGTEAATSAAGGGSRDQAANDAPEPEASRSNSTPSGRILPRASKRVQVSSGVMAGSLIYSRQPTYPRGFARLFHSEGSVVMQAIISKTGRVENLRVISGHYTLRGAAKDAVRTWRYRPYRVNGSPVEVATIVSVEFQR